MGDPDTNQPSKKRAAGVQLSRDNPGLDDNEETSENESGTFKRASDEVIAARRIVKVRRQQTSSTTSAAAPSSASNPFAAIRLIPTAPAVQIEPSVTSGEAEQIDNNDGKSENKVGEAKGEPNVEEKTAVIDDDAKNLEGEVDESKAEPNDEKGKADEISKENITKPVVEEAENGTNSVDGATKTGEGDNGTETGNDIIGKRNEEAKETEEATTEKNAETASFSSFQQLSSSKNAFSGLTGTGFSGTPFSFGSAPKDGSSTGSLFGLGTQQPSFGFGVSKNGDSSSMFGTTGANIVGKSESSKFPPIQEVPLETGEENEKAVFTADSVLFEFTDGLWKERGKGELKVNIPTSGTGKARLIMRARGNYRLILNASLFPDMKLTNMEKKGITFACINSAGEGKDGLSTIALKFKDPSIVGDFRAAVMEHKSKTPVALKTPENSPKASDE